MLLALEMSLLARELSKAGHWARSSRMAEARAIASTYRGCGGNTEAAMGVFGPTLSRKMDRGVRTAGTMEECPACSRNPGFDIIVLRVSTNVPKY